MTPSRSIRPSSRSASSHGSCSRQAARLWICSISTRPKARRCAAYCALPSSTESAQIFVATDRLGATPLQRKALPSDASAAPYIGDESNTGRARAERGADDLRGKALVVEEGLVRPEPDDRAEPPLLHHPSSARAWRPAANAAAKNHGIVVCMAAHVGEGEVRSRRPASRRPSTSTTSPSVASCSSPAASDLALAEDESQRRAGVVGDAAVALARVATRVPDDDDRPAAERSGGVRRVGDGKPAVAERRAAADDPGADAADDDVEAPSPSPRRAPRRASRPARLRRSTGPPRSPSRAGGESSAAAPCPRARPAARPHRAAHRRCARPARSRRRPARAGCAARSRRPAGRRAPPPAASCSSTQPTAHLPGRVGKRHHMGALGGGCSPRPRVRLT